jgi:hypothetical protein
MIKIPKDQRDLSQNLGSMVLQWRGIFSIDQTESRSLDTKNNNREVQKFGSMTYKNVSCH